MKNEMRKIAIAGTMLRDMELPKSVTDYLDVAMIDNSQIIMADQGMLEIKIQEYLALKQYANVLLIIYNFPIYNKAGWGFLNIDKEFIIRNFMHKTLYKFRVNKAISLSDEVLCVNFSNSISVDRVKNKAGFIPVVFIPLDEYVNKHLKNIGYKK
jgi:hypothetical protein